MTIAVDLDLRGRPQLPEPRMFLWSEQPVLVLDRGMPWLYGPVERDPLMTARGQIVLPRREIKRLRALAAQNVPFQRLAIAHELDPDGPASDIVPLLGEGPRTCTDAVARRLVGPQPVHPWVRRASHVGRYGWITATIEDAEALDTALEWLRESYYLKAPATVRDEAFR